MADGCGRSRRDYELAKGRLGQGWARTLNSGTERSNRSWSGRSSSSWRDLAGDIGHGSDGSQEGRLGQWAVIDGNLAARDSGCRPATSHTGGRWQWWQLLLSVAAGQIVRKAGKQDRGKGR